MNTVSNSQPALIVDWDDLRTFHDLDEWLSKKQKSVAVVLFVADPVNNDYDPQHSYIVTEPSVVLRNSAKSPLPDIAFKTAAILAVQETSNLVPVIGIDSNNDVLDMYEEAGIVVTAKPEYVDKVTGLR